MLAKVMLNSLTDELKVLAALHSRSLFLIPLTGPHSQGLTNYGPQVQSGWAPNIIK